MDSNNWQPVPSLDCKYEVTESGRLRNAKTKRILKRHYPYAYAVKINGRTKYLSIRSLLWEVHGIIKPAAPRIVPITIFCDGQKRYFPTLAVAAKFLADKFFFAVSTIRVMLCGRKTEICGCKITYHLPDGF